MVSGEDIPNFYFNKGGGAPVVFLQHTGWIYSGFYATLDMHTVPVV